MAPKPCWDGAGELNREFRRLAEAYALAAREVLGDNLVSVVLFGSVARGEAGPGSDIDLLVVCRELSAGAFRRRRLVEPVEERVEPALQPLWEQGLCAGFTVVLRTEAEATCFHRPYLDMVEDAVLLYNRGGFFAGVLARLGERLQALGAERRRLGDVAYWDLKPDFRPGDVIEL